MVTYVYKVKKIVCAYYFLAHFTKLISHYKKIGFNINVLQITVDNFAFIYNGLSTDLISDPMTVPTRSKEEGKYQESIQSSTTPDPGTPHIYRLICTSRVGA